MKGVYIMLVSKKVIEEIYHNADEDKIKKVKELITLTGLPKSLPSVALTPIHTESHYTAAWLQQARDT